MDIFKAVVSALNPKGGGGLVESIIVVTLLFLVVYCQLTGTELMPIVDWAFKGLIGFILGQNHIREKVKKERKSENDG